MRKRVVLIVGLVAATFVISGSAAFAHVAVDATDASRGAEASTLTFRVPNEQDNASTTKVEVFLPVNAKFAFVATQPMAGWTATTDDEKVTWSGGKIGPGQFDEFKLEVGPLPKAASVVFKAIQTYDNGDVVRWIDPTPASGDEPEHPAPVLTLTAAADDASNDKDASSDGVARVLGAAGVALGAVAVALGARRTKNNASTR